MNRRDLQPTIAASMLPRRASLLESMTTLETSGISCASCSGICCTFVANSMQVTPLETYDMLVALEDDGRINGDLIQRLAETVQAFGLDRPVPGDGRRNFARRTYTCPFFQGGGTGCTLPKQSKPYGCLGFNAREPGVKDGGKCGTEPNVLEAREHCVAGEPALNETAAKALGVTWTKLPIPLALLDVLTKQTRP